MNKKQKKVLYRVIVTAIIMIALHFIDIHNKLIEFVIYMIPYFIIGFDVLKKAFHGIKSLQPCDENFLMAVATVGAIALGEYTEGVAVMLFYQIGELFQSYAVGKSRKNISELMDIRPDTAYIEDEEGKLESVDPDEVEIGSIIVVKPGDRIPIDGVVTEGASSLDTSALTGESVPRDITAGDHVQSGCINVSGLIKIRTEKEFGESTASKILEMVENASSKKSRSENFISRFARIYTPTVCILALALALFVPILNLLVGNATSWNIWIYRALTFLVISCPCALVISIPLTFFAGIGGASNAGVLVKGSVYLEGLSEVRNVVCDKTGTLTEGVFEVTDIIEGSLDKDKLLELAAHAESFSNHPISLSIQKAYTGQIDNNRIAEVSELSGHGVEAKIDGIKVAAGNSKLMDELKVNYRSIDIPGTKVYLSADGVFAGCIIISDKIKSSSAEAIRQLKSLGIKTVMLTGDVKQTADAVAAELGLDEVYSELLPGDKVEMLERIIAEQRSKAKTAFTGDGINDAPVLSRADIGIAMGALGSDAAIEAADIVLMDDDPVKIPKAIRIARKCMRIVYENIYFAIGIKVLCLVLGAIGIANMWAAIFADVGVMVLAVLNAIRALYVRKL